MSSINKAQAERCVTHGFACPCREYRFKQLEEAAEELADAMWRLNQDGFIGTHDDYADLDYYKEAQCQHWLEIARQAVERIRALTVGDKKEVLIDPDPI